MKTYSTLTLLIVLFSTRLYAQTYEVTVDVLWNAIDHPTNFPMGNAHVSPLIGASHREVMTVWAPGAMASANVEALAEAGDRSGLEAMFDVSPNVLTKFVEPGPTDAPGTIGPLTFEVNDEFPLVSFATMVAPSSDWFFGVSRLDLRENGEFVDSLTVDLFAYDAGTENGTMFDPNNMPTMPQETIELVDQMAYFGGMSPVGRATFTQVVPEPGSNVLGVLGICALGVYRRRR